MKRLFLGRRWWIALLLSCPLSGQLTQATGDDFTVAVWNDTHTERGRTTWTNAVDWMLGLNGRGPAGQSARSYWNIKAIAGVGDMVSTGGDDCDTAAVGSWTFATGEFNRLFALGLPGIWPQGNHDICAQYTTLFGAIPGISYGASATLQSQTFDVAVTGGIVRLGFVGAGVADDMASGQPSRTFVDAAIAASQSNRQWMFLRHVGTYEDNGTSGAVHVYPADGNLGWCNDTTQCAGNVGVHTGTALRDAFYQHEAQVYWGTHGHNGYVAFDSLVADDGHTVNVTGNLGASGNPPGWITLWKFRPSHSDIQVAAYLAYNGVTGSLYAGPHTIGWTPLLVSNGNTAMSGGVRVTGAVH